VTKKVQDVRNTLAAINGLLGWGFISPPTRIQLEVFKEELEAELRFLRSHQNEVTAG
jgi:hypothetical protein